MVVAEWSRRLKDSFDYTVMLHNATRSVTTLCNAYHTYNRVVDGNVLSNWEYMRAESSGEVEYRNLLAVAQAAKNVSNWYCKSAEHRVPEIEGLGRALNRLEDCDE